MKKIETYQCDNCKHIWVEPIGVKKIIIDWFKTKRCPRCNKIYVEYAKTFSSGPR